MRLRPRRLVHDSGQALAEYALILALASLGIISALIILQGSSLGNSMQASGPRSTQRSRDVPVSRFRVSLRAVRRGQRDQGPATTAGSSSPPLMVPLDPQMTDVSAALAPSPRRRDSGFPAEVKEDHPVLYIIRWMEQRGVGAYNVGWVCV
jgi:Flp pilus assembly pilin Flp